MESALATVSEGYVERFFGNDTDESAGQRTIMEASRHPNRGIFSV